MRRILLLTILIGFSIGAYLEDLVPFLPDMANFTDFRLYSGYLSIRGTGKTLHYMFAESERDPVNDPLLIWFNGGPGCSSMLGFLQEHGPYVMEDGDDKWTKNEYSWNKEANIVYIESPAGVGFSFCDDMRMCQDFNDENSSWDHLDALFSFFEKFPEYRKNDLYITGESYAGIYVPYLAYRIHNYNEEVQKDSRQNKILFNLKGIVIGNGVTNWKWDGNQAYVEIAMFHGLYGTELHQKMKDNDCNYYYIDYKSEDTEECKALYRQFKNLTSKINIYDFYRPCYQIQSNDTHLLKAGPPHGEVLVGSTLKTYRRHYTTKDYTPWAYESDSSGYQGHLLPCFYGLPVIDWINREDVRQALHIPDIVQAWHMCSDDIGYSKEYNASEWIYPILKNKYRIFHYSGPTDGAVPTRGTRQWMNNLNWEITEQWRPYFINDTLIGYIEERDGMTFATVHGTGHMVPQWKRAEAYHIVFNWIFGRPI